MTAHAYYRACEGRWSGPFVVAVTDARALRAARGVVEAMGWQILSRLPGLRMTTSVAVLSPELVRHTTRLHWGPLTVMDGEETLSLRGSGLSLEGASRTVLGERSTVRATGTVDSTSTRATYALHWLGMDVQQTGTRTAQGVTLEQQGPGFRSRVVLTRPPTQPGRTRL